MRCSLHRWREPYLRSNPAARLRAFSLVELAVVLAIMSVMVGGGIAMTNFAIDYPAYWTTQERLDTTQKVLLDYALAWAHSLPVGHYLPRRIPQLMGQLLAPPAIAIPPAPWRCADQAIGLAGQIRRARRGV